MDFQRLAALDRGDAPTHPGMFDAGQLGLDRACRDPRQGWVDAPGPPGPRAEQDVLYQWVDNPTPGHLQAQRLQYMAPPYYQGQVGLGFQGLVDPLLAAQREFAYRQTPLMDAPYQIQTPGVNALYAQQAQEQLLLQQQASLNNGSYQLFDAPAKQPPDRCHGAVAGPGCQAQQKKVVIPTKKEKQQQQQQQQVDEPRGRHRQPVAGGLDARTRSKAEPDVKSATENLRPMLLSAIESLYTDRIKPMSNYVKGRLKEKSCPEDVIKNFVDLYAEHPDLFTVSSDEAFLLVNEPTWFKGWVDIDSSQDPYPEEMWEGFAQFLDGEHTFAGGRYGMARELIQRDLPFLAGLSLGEVCHIVQLAIQHRRLIVYHRKMLKPIRVVLAQPAATPEVGNEGKDISDMDDLCVVLFRMLANHPQGLRLCRLKQMIKHDFSRQLSEMSFRCTKLIELFGTEPLSGTFVLDTESDGKSIYVRLGNPETFSLHVKQLYASQ